MMTRHRFPSTIRDNSPDQSRVPSTLTFTTYNHRSPLNILSVLTFATVGLGVALLITAAYLTLSNNENHTYITWVDALTGTLHYKKNCSGIEGRFSIAGMDNCHTWLQCENFKWIKSREQIGQGAVKIVFLATWQNLQIAYNNLLVKSHRSDFRFGVAMLKRLGPSEMVVSFVGECGDAFLTEYHPYGTLAHFLHQQNDHLTIEMRMKLCLNYVRVIQYLHNSPIGIRVMCDTNDLNKVLSQFLVREDLTVIVNDLDALPEVDYTRNKKIKCGHRELTGDFVAPEQLWPYDEQNFQDKKMPGYTEKIDIWKIPDVCNYILGDSSEADIARMHLFKIHLKCKSINPNNRPTAREVLTIYQEATEFFMPL